MSVIKIQLRILVLNLDHEIAKVFGMEHTVGKIVQGMSEFSYSSGCSGETAFYILNALDTFFSSLISPRPGE